MARFVWIFCLSILSLTALADGCYIPEIAVKKLPSVPAQRAIVSWKDGVETLVISSALDSASQKLGWIIPLPAVPTSVEKQSPGPLKTLGGCIQPKITHDLQPEIMAAFYIVFFVNSLLVVILFKPERLLGLLLFYALLALLSGSMLSASGGHGAAAANASLVQVEKTARVGAYETAILRAQKAADLNLWLGENGFAPLPENAAKIVDGYIAEHWVFSAVKLVREDAGANAPHPLKMVFPAKAPVYPLKLTAVAGDSTAFEIFVLAQTGVSCDLLKKEFSDRFVTHQENSDSEQTTWRLSGVSSKLNIRHPVLCDMMWDGCVLTKFSGSLRSGQMTQDIRFGEQPFKPVREHFYSHRGARSLAVLVFIWACGGWFFLSLLPFASKKPKDSASVNAYLARVFLPPALLLVVAAGILYLCLPKLDDAGLAFSHDRWQGRRTAAKLRQEIAYLISQQPDKQGDIGQKSEREIAALILRGPFASPKPGLLVEDSPGNFTVEKKEKQVLIRTYDHDGRPNLLEY